MKLGAHESTAGGAHKAFANGESDGCESIQIFTRSSRSWKSKPLTEKVIEAWRQERERTGIDAPASHASYLINLAATNDDVLQKSLDAFRDEILRCAQLDIPYVVLHPGSHLEASEAEGIAKIASNINRVIDEMPDAASVRIALENTAGQGTNLGWRFEHLRDILDQIEHQDRTAVCFDTCHAFAAGFNLIDPDEYEATFESFDRIIGLDRLALFHLNDTKNELGSHRDRHEIIGDGALGLEPFRRLINDPRFTDHSGLLETPPLPNGDMSYEHCLKVLKDLREQ